jgi:putative Mg2+ transporter-C (MgtC) family protein
VEWNSVINIAVGWALTFVLGFEREVRGAPAGDRTFSMIGLATALIGTVAPHYPAVLGGAVTGIGFIGGGLCFRQAVKQAEQEREILHGVTTAASVFGAAAIGAIAGCGELVVAAAAAVGILLSLEIRHIPLLRYLDARRWAHLFNDDNHKHFNLHDIEHALAHPHQEYGELRAAHLQHERAKRDAASHAATATAMATAEAAAGTPTTPASPSSSTGQTVAHSGISLVGPIEDDSLVQEGETAAILANEVIQSAARGGR